MIFFRMPLSGSERAWEHFLAVELESLECLLPTSNFAFQLLSGKIRFACIPFNHLMITTFYTLSLRCRYSAVRRQFSAQDGASELPVIEYQLQQWRLFPYLAGCYVLAHFAKTFFMNFVELRLGLMMNDNSERQGELGREIHALSCASKPLAAWLARDAVQECREACGGHGYMKGMSMCLFFIHVHVYLKFFCLSKCLFGF